jgi:hypothetical protein
VERDPVSEEQAVWWHRYQEACDAGLSHEEAAVFAESGEDVGTLRKLVEGGCPPAMIGRIVT